MIAKLYLIVSAVCIAAVACTKSASKPDIEAEKPAIVETEPQLHRISFNFSDFEISYQGGKAIAKEMAVKDFLKSLYYAVYDSTGEEIKRIDFGSNSYPNKLVPAQIQDSLKAGKYTIVFAGGKDTLCVNPGKTTLSDLSIMNWFNQDIFYKKFVLTVSDHDTSLTSIRLERITGSLEVTLKDSVLPANVASLVFLTRNRPGYFGVMQDVIVGLDSSYAGDFNPGFNSYPVNITSSYFGSNSNLQVVIRAYDKTRAIIKEKIVDGVHVYVNKKTVLSGKLFPTPSEVEIPITVDPDFAETINQTF
ncbi:FimB/Mfa2 family fimbrial subunit [Danxiaibacter flavus]|uniref:FimB/Mfa2 family fimbrial subunit n=1 Tax=Danxiaibacter flavus TaxID=3049108 RepID=A0ABV3Z9S6_9BACT|nr:FimB/Mfa2 family fimbrial subunit [Chitinophagaceae bacterium DXS]